MAELLPQGVVDLARTQIRAEASSVASLSEQIGDGFVAVATALFRCAGHVVVSGSGTSRSVAMRFAHLLSCCGTPSLFLDPIDGQHGLAGALTERDCLFVFSKGGETAEIISLACVAAERSTKIVTVTENPDSTLGKISTYVLKTTSGPDCDPFGAIALGSSLTNSAIGDALCAVLLSMRGYTLQQFAAIHPAGAVGNKLRDLRRGEVS